jgi:TonB family protein
VRGPPCQQVKLTLDWLSVSLTRIGSLATGQFRPEVYLNWVLPPLATLGWRGHVDIEFVVERDGSLSSVQIIKKSGTAPLDKAAQNALQSSRFLPLPADYGPPRLTIVASFYYNEVPAPLK